MKREWYKNSYKRCLVDMHIPDWNEKFFSELDPVNYADMMALSGADTAIISAGSCLGICDWPTRYGYMHKQLKGRDILKELIGECRKRDLNVVLYFNVWSRWAYDTHPEWRIILPDGKGTVEKGSRFGLCCPNTGYRNYFLDVIGELCSSYDSDGLWIDMIGWFSKICCCPACRERFLRETGKEIPNEINWKNPDWILFQRKREEWNADFAEAISSKIRKLKPDISLAFQNTSMLHAWAGGVNLKFTRQGDYLSGDFYGDRVEISFICKLLNSLSVDHPIEFMTSRCETLDHHTTNKPVETLSMQSYAALANNACFVFIDAIDPGGTLDRKFYMQAQAIFSEIEKYRPFLEPDSEQLADVAVYYSFESMFDPALDGKNISEFSRDISSIERIKNIVKTLSEKHIPFTLMTEKDLNTLGKYQVVILSNVMVMDGDEVNAFRRYVARGGRIYASMQTSLWDKNAAVCGDFQLADVFGVSNTGEFIPKISYMAPLNESVFGGEFSTKYPLMIEKNQFIVKAEKNTGILARMILPYSDPDDIDFFASAISNPPGINTENPSLTRKKYGEGEVVYSAGDIESLVYDSTRNAFAGIITGLFSNPPLFSTSAPGAVEITVFKQALRKRLIINVLNFQMELPPVPVHNIKLTLALRGITPLRLFFAPGEVDVNYIMNTDILEFEIDKLEMFKMFVLDYE